MFVCENNLYGEFTPMQQVTGGRRHRRPRADAYGMPAAVVDGNDLWAVAEAARDGGRPRPRRRRADAARGATYRHYGHSKSDPATYRPKEEVERWMERDPLKLARARLLELGVGEDEIARDRGATSRAELDRAVEAALAAPYPDPAEDGATEFARMSTLEFRVAIRDAIAEEMERDDERDLPGRGRRRRRRRLQGHAGPASSASAPTA